MKKLITCFLAVVLSSSIHAQVTGKDTIPEVKVPPTYKAKLVEGLRDVEFVYWFKSSSNTYGLEFKDSSSTFVRVIAANSGEDNAKTYKVVPFQQVPPDLVAKLDMLYGIGEIKVARVYYRSNRYIFEVKDFMGTRLVELL